MGSTRTKETQGVVGIVSGRKQVFLKAEKRLKGRCVHGEKTFGQVRCHRKDLRWYVGKDKESAIHKEAVRQKCGGQKQ